MPHRSVAIVVLTTSYSSATSHIFNIPLRKCKLSFAFLGCHYACFEVGPLAVLSLFLTLICTACFFCSVIPALNTVLIIVRLFRSLFIILILKIHSRYFDPVPSKEHLHSKSINIILQYKNLHLIPS
jgi:hypothetical protein